MNPSSNKIWDSSWYSGESSNVMGDGSSSLFKCALCGKNVPVDLDGNGSTNTLRLVEHVRYDMGYTPFHCGHRLCAVSWPSERSFAIHCRIKHTNDDKLLVNHDDPFLSAECDYLVGLVFREAFVGTADQGESLQDYLATERSREFEQRLVDWWRNVHLPAVADGSNCDTTSTSDKENAPVETPQNSSENAIEDRGSEMEDLARESSMADIGDSGVDAGTSVASLPCDGSTAISGTNASRGPVIEEVFSLAQLTKRRASSVEGNEGNKRKKHVYASYVRSYQDSDGQLASSSNADTGMEYGYRDSECTVSPEGPSGCNSQIEDPVEAVLRDALGGAAPKVWQQNRDGYRPCTLCEKVIKKISQPKHSEKHLQAEGEVRYECLVCPKEKRLRTIYTDTMKIRHLPICHKIPKQRIRAGVHYIDYTKEHNILEKRRNMQYRCFPRLRKTQITQHAPVSQAADTALTNDCCISENECEQAPM